MNVPQCNPHAANKYPANTRRSPNGGPASQTVGQHWGNDAGPPLGECFVFVGIVLPSADISSRTPADYYRPYNPGIIRCRLIIQKIIATLFLFYLGL